jgi:hypothetical protein
VKVDGRRRHVITSIPGKSKMEEMRYWEQKSEVGTSIK